jgi:hypothetical protein
MLQRVYDPPPTRDLPHPSRGSNNISSMGSNASTCQTNFMGQVEGAFGIKRVERGEESLEICRRSGICARHAQRVNRPSVSCPSVVH